MSNNFLWLAILIVLFGITTHSKWSYKKWAEECEKLPSIRIKYLKKVGK